MKHQLRFLYVNETKLCTRHVWGGLNSILILALFCIGCAGKSGYWLYNQENGFIYGPITDKAELTLFEGVPYGVCTASSGEIKLHNKLRITHVQLLFEGGDIFAFVEVLNRQIQSANGGFRIEVFVYPDWRGKFIPEIPDVGMLEGSVYEILQTLNRNWRYFNIVLEDIDTLTLAVWGKLTGEWWPDVSEGNNDAR